VLGRGADQRSRAVFLEELDVASDVRIALELGQQLAPRLEQRVHVHVGSVGAVLTGAEIDLDVVLEQERPSVEQAQLGLLDLIAPVAEVEQRQAELGVRPRRPDREVDDRERVRAERVRQHAPTLGRTEQQVARLLDGQQPRRVDRVGRAGHAIEHELRDPPGVLDEVGAAGIVDVGAKRPEQAQAQGHLQPQVLAHAQEASRSLGRRGPRAGHHGPTDGAVELVEPRDPCTVVAGLERLGDERAEVGRHERERGSGLPTAAGPALELGLDARRGEGATARLEQEAVRDHASVARDVDDDRGCRLGLGRRHELAAGEQRRERRERRERRPPRSARRRGTAEWTRAHQRASPVVIGSACSSSQGTAIMRSRPHRLAARRWRIASIVAARNAS